MAAAGAMIPLSPTPLIPSGLIAEGKSRCADVEWRNLVGSRQRVLHERAGEELAFVVVEQLLHQRAADSLDHAAVELPLHHHRIDGSAAIVDGDMTEQTHRAIVEVHVEDDTLRAERPRDGAWVEEPAMTEPGAAGVRERRAPHRRPRHLAEGQAPVGNALDEHTAAVEHDVVGSALEQLGGDEPGLLRHLCRRARDGRSRHGGHPARDGSHAVADELRVAALDHDAVERHGELIGADLGQRRLVRLALGGHADVDEDGAAWIHTHVGALEGPEAGSLDVGGEPDPDGPRASASPLLLLAPPGVSEPLEHLLERGRVVGGIVHDARAVAVREARLVRHLLGPDQVPPAQLGRIHPEPAGRAIEQPVHDERRLGPPGATIGGREGLVRDDVLARRRGSAGSGTARGGD